METIEAMKKRRSIRRFKEDEVPRETITELLEAARLAPSGMNLQPWRFVVVKSASARKKIAQATPLSFVTEAPVVLVCCVDLQAIEQENIFNRARELSEAGAFAGTSLEELDPAEYSRRRKMEKETARNYLALNAAIAIDHITLRAVELGLGTCWVLMFSRKKVREALGLEERYDVVALLPVGYPDQDPAPRPRLSLEELILEEM